MDKPTCDACGATVADAWFRLEAIDDNGAAEPATFVCSTACLVAAAITVHQMMVDRAAAEHHRAAGLS